ncbi:probable transcriptional regulatory protein Dgeo_2194 [Ornithodoros turicata]|uniref:probable transcriptional regulatory protein Dgeo_2194 n=1 Tax=Ornithodoros turicata TaxID=34597 RepID=UPI0031386470
MLRKVLFQATAKQTRRQLTSIVRHGDALAGTAPRPANCVLLISKRGAGHSHWQNVRHIKAEKDANKAKQTDKYVRQIVAAVKVGGGPDPKLNKLLADVIECAKRTQVVSNSAIDLAIKRAAGALSAKNLRSTQYEIVMEHGVLLVVEAETGNISKLGHELKNICKRHTCAIVRGGVKEKFETKGFVKLGGRDDGTKVDMDAALAVGLENGAEDVTELPDGTCEFVCGPNERFALAKALTTAGYMVTENGVRLVPYMAISPPEEQLDKVSNLCDELEDHPDILVIHTNLA